MHRRTFAVPLVLLLCSFGWACSSSSVKEPAPRSPAADGAVAPTSGPLPDEAPPSDTAEDSSAEQEIPRDNDPTLITLGQAEAVKRPPTLAEASARALEERRRRGRGQPTAGPLITNENLSEFAAEGQVTFSPGSTAKDSTQPSGDAGDSREAFWRGRVLEIRTAWAEAHEQIEILEEETSSLRWRFYAEDDGYYRDERIKPEWDRALDELREARQTAREQQELLEEVLEDGRRAGALPGWLREGIELEPEPEAEGDPQPRRQDPIPPPIYNPDDSNF